jgi:hypothetical protein
VKVVNENIYSQLKAYTESEGKCKILVECNPLQFRYLYYHSINCLCIFSILDLYVPNKHCNSTTKNKYSFTKICVLVAMTTHMTLYRALRINRLSTQCPHHRYQHQKLSGKNGYTRYLTCKTQNRKWFKGPNIIRDTFADHLYGAGELPWQYLKKKASCTNEITLLFTVYVCAIARVPCL